MTVIICSEDKCSIMRFFFPNTEANKNCADFALTPHPNSVTSRYCGLINVFNEKWVGDDMGKAKYEYRNSAYHIDNRASAFHVTSADSLTLKLYRPACSTCKFPQKFADKEYLALFCHRSISFCPISKPLRYWIRHSLHGAWSWFDFWRELAIPVYKFIWAEIEGRVWTSMYKWMYVY